MDGQDVLSRSKGRKGAKVVHLIRFLYYMPGVNLGIFFSTSNMN